jgi:acetyl-CoA acetyltransferase
MTWTKSRSVAVVGVGHSRLVRDQTPLPILALEAATRAIADCGLTPADIDGVATYPAPAGAPYREDIDVVGVEGMVHYAHLTNVRWLSQVNLGLVVAAMTEAVHAIASGACQNALVWKTMRAPARHNRGPCDAVETTERPSSLATGSAQYVAPYGVTSALQWAAMKFENYLRTYHADREAMSAVVLNARANAVINENAIFHGRPLTAEEYASSEMVAAPLRLHDCDIPVTGAIAVLLTSAEIAKDMPHPPAYIASIGVNGFRERRTLNYTLADHIETGGRLAAQLWRDAGLGPSDMGSAQLYDGFSPSVWYWLEAAGFCGRGEASKFASADRTCLTGELPINTFGGSLSQGRMHGMGHIAEAALQVMGRGGSRQVDRADAVCMFDGSPMVRGGGLVLSRS